MVSLDTNSLIHIQTRSSKSLIFSATGMGRSFHKVVSSHILRFAIATRAFTSLEQSPFDDLREPIYLNCFIIMQYTRIIFDPA